MVEIDPATNSFSHLLLPLWLFLLVLTVLFDVLFLGITLLHLSVLIPVFVESFSLDLFLVELYPESYKLVNTAVGKLYPTWTTLLWGSESGSVLTEDVNESFRATLFIAWGKVLPCEPDAPEHGAKYKAWGNLIKAREGIDTPVELPFESLCKRLCFAWEVLIWKWI